MKRIALLGSTGSIGTSTLDVVRCANRSPGETSVGSEAWPLEVAALVACKSWRELAVQCQEFRPTVAVLSDAKLTAEVDCSLFPPETELKFGTEAVVEVARRADVDVVVSAISGAAGLEGTLAAIEAGKRVALANKETLVMAGPLALDLVAKTGAELLPVDSEHSAIFQCLAAGRASEVERIILTASGGPFRTWSSAQLESVTVAQALDHPTWRMGRKITIDSATLLNKALELIEARWLFQMPADKLSVVIHPQSIAHSMVEFIDGSVIAQLSPPDMKLPIQYAIEYPRRVRGPARRMNWQESVMLEFSPPDLDRFPGLSLGFDVARDGGTCGAVLNAANEIAVEKFLAGELPFVHIPRACRDILKAHTFEARPTLDRLLALDTWARKEMRRWNS